MLRLFSLLAMSACLAAQTLPPGFRNSPALNSTWRVTIHNAYWHGVPGSNGDFFSSGPKQHLLDDLYIDRARGLEFDLHSNHGMEFDVYHTAPVGYSLCFELTDCLAIVKTWHLTNTGHDPLFLHLEAKESNPIPTLFDPGGLTPWSLDSTLMLGLASGQPVSPFFTPKDYFEWCEGHTGRGFGDDLRAAVAACGWPSLDFLRGRIIATFHGTLDGNAHQVYDYTHNYNRTIRDAVAFPMASAVGKGSLDILPCGDSGHPDGTYSGNVCDWNSHSILLDLITTDPGEFTTEPPFNGNPEPVIEQFKGDQGLFRSNSDSGNDFGGMVDAIRHLRTVEVSGYNLIATDASRANPLNDLRYGPNNGSLHPWAAGCLEKPDATLVSGCDPATLAEPSSGIQVSAAGLGPNPGLTDNFSGDPTNDNIYFLSQAIKVGNGQFRAFISTRTDSNLGGVDPNYGDDQLGRWGCLMARPGPRPTGVTFPLGSPDPPFYAPNSPYFAVCRLRHRLNWGISPGAPEDGIFVMWRANAGDQAQGVHLQGHNELDPYVALNHNDGGTCWNASARVTDNPDIAAVPLLAQPICFNNVALNQIGLATDGGARSEQNYLGEYLFGSVRYNGIYQLGNFFQGHNIGSTFLNGKMTDRSYLEGLCAPDLTPFLKISGGGFQRQGFSSTYVQRVTITNNTGKDIAGPLHLAVTALTDGVTVSGPGIKTTGCRYPISPSVDVDIPTSSTLFNNASVSVVLTFQSPANQQIKYVPQVLGRGTL